jgi:hypothetical protein
MKSSLIIAIFLFLFSHSDHAATLSLESCAKIENPVERLTCYDKVSGRLPADTAKASNIAPNTVDPVVPKANVTVTVAPATTSTEPAVEPKPGAKENFGLEHKQKPKDDQPDEMQIRWTRKMQDAHGKWIIFLENGQVWRQTEGADFSFNNPEQLVVISRGILGSFFLTELDGSRRIRVMRVK